MTGVGGELRWALAPWPPRETVRPRVLRGVAVHSLDFSATGHTRTHRIARPYALWMPS